MSAYARGQGGLLGRLYGQEGPPWGKDPGVLNEDAVRDTLAGPLGWLYGHWFRLDVRGWEKIPDGPVMMVSNHSGGTSIPDAWGFMSSWYRHFGMRRPLHPMAHELVLSNQLTGEFFATRGVLRAGRRLAHEVLTEWKRDLMVFPGGDKETWRPYAQRYEVSFGGRSGYARIAMEAGVPIVPVAHAGSHETFVVLATGKRIARALNLPKFARAEIWPISLSLPWGLAIGPVPHLPTPALLRWRIGAPIPPPSGPVTDEAVAAFDAAVQARIQAMLDELAAERVVLAERIVDHARLQGARVALRLRRLSARVRDRVAAVAN